MSLTLALLSFALAGPSQLSCEDLRVEVPSPTLAFKLPRGFAWEGLSPVATLADGRLLLARYAALDGLSRKDMQAHQAEASPARLMQLIVVDPAGAVVGATTFPRGTIVEAHAMPGGGILIAHRTREAARLLHLPPGATAPIVVPLPEMIAIEETWRDLNPVKGTGPTRLLPTGPTTVVHAWGGEASAFDLGSAEVVRAAPVWSSQLALVGAGDQGVEFFGVELGDRLVRLSGALERLDQRSCPGCRVVPLRGAGSELPARAALGIPDGGSGVRVAFLAAGASLAGPPDGLLVPLPAPLVGAPWAWSLRPGVDGAALLAISGTAEVRDAFVYELRPAEPAARLRWAEPAGAPGQRVVADAVSGQVRLRLVTGEGVDTRTHGASLLGPSAQARSDWTDADSSPGDSRALLFDHHAPFAQGAHTGVVLDADPMFERVAPGPHTAEIRRCTLAAPSP
jgi:hypothetical protein